MDRGSQFLRWPIEYRYISFSHNSETENGDVKLNADSNVANNAIAAAVRKRFMQYTLIHFGKNQFIILAYSSCMQGFWMRKNMDKPNEESQELCTKSGPFDQRAHGQTNSNTSCSTWVII